MFYNYALLSKGQQPAQVWIITLSVNAFGNLVHKDINRGLSIMSSRTHTGPDNIHGRV